MIQINVKDWEDVTLQQLSYQTPDEHALYEDNFKTEISKVIADIKTAAEDRCFFVIC